jgi:HYR domain
VRTIIDIILAILTFYFSSYLPYVNGENTWATEAFAPVLQAIPGAEDERERNSPTPTPTTSTTPTTCPTDENGDTTPPDIFVPDDITGEATGPDGAGVSFEISAEDNVDGAVDVSCNYDSGETFPIGETIVTCTAEDSAGNTAEESFTVTVQEPVPEQPPPAFVPEQPEPQQPEPDGNVTESG